MRLTNAKDIVHAKKIIFDDEHKRIDQILSDFDSTENVIEHLYSDTVLIASYSIKTKDLVIY